MCAVQQPKSKPTHLEQVTWAEVTWVNIERPTEADMACLAESYPFHPLDLADCLSKIQRPKLDVYKEYEFLIFHYSVWYKIKRIGTAEQVSVFISAKYVITIHSGRFTPLANLFRQCQSDERVRQDHFKNGTGYLLYSIIDCAVDSYFPILDKLLTWADTIEESVFDENVEAAKEVFILRRDVITQRRIMMPNRLTFGELETKLARFSKVELAPYFGDVMDHMNKICETLDEAKDIIESFKDTDYILSTNRIKRFLRILTILGCIIAPFFIISCIYALISIPRGAASFPTFIIAIVLMVIIAGVTLVMLRSKRLI